MIIICYAKSGDIEADLIAGVYLHIISKVVFNTKMCSIQFADNEKAIRITCSGLRSRNRHFISIYFSFYLVSPCSNIRIFNCNIVTIAKCWKIVSLVCYCFKKF